MHARYGNGAHVIFPYVFRSQIMHARYGKGAHVIFVVLALLVNLCVISTLVVAGVSTIQSNTIDASDEFCVVIIAILFGSYSFIGKI